jgi:uncharacterized protein YhaN
MMRLVGIRLRRFKRFGDWSATFAPGLNVIRGPNEAGKSTVMEAILEALFGAGRPDAASRLRSWGEQRLGEITLELQVRNARYLLRRDLEAGTVLLQTDDGRDRIEVLRDVQRRLMDWIGLASEGAYRTTAFVTQADIARVSEDRRLLSTHLSRIMSGAGAETVQSAAQWISDQRTRIQGASGGPRTLTDRIAELRAQQSNSRQREERAQRHRAELRDVTRRLEEIEREANEKAELVRAARWANDLQRREQILIHEETSAKEQLTRAEGLLAKLHALDGHVADFSAQQEAQLAELFNARRNYQNVESAHIAAREQAEREERALEDLATKHQSASRVGTVGGTLAISGAIAVAGGLAVFVLTQFVGGLALAGVGLAVAAFGLMRRTKVTETGVDYRTQEAKVLELRRRTDVLQRQIAEAQETVGAKLRALGGASLEDVEKRFASYMEMLRQREELRASLRSIRSGDPKTALENRVKEIGTELASVRQTLASLPKGVRKVQADGTDQVEQQAAQLNAELQDLREKRARLEGVLEESLLRGDDGARLEEEIAVLQVRADRQNHMLEILDLTGRLLEEARTVSVYPAREMLERRTGEYMATATDGAYTRVAVDERSLRPQVWIPQAGTWKDPTELSQGTSDQLYLCLRLALLDVLTADRKAPLFLDEPFAHLDDQRRRSMLSLLNVAARDRQVVLFTCWAHYDQIAEKVIVLERTPVAPS